MSRILSDAMLPPGVDLFLYAGRHPLLALCIIALVVTVTVVLIGILKRRKSK